MYVRCAHTASRKYNYVIFSEELFRENSLPKSISRAEIVWKIAYGSQIIRSQYKRSDFSIHKIDKNRDFNITFYK